MAVEVDPGAGHVLPLEAPAFCARLIERSLAAHPQDHR
jgi:pimeloyl-ACP methyl ester carboxylesterase